MGSSNTPRAKKSETIEVRVSHETKTALQVKCREDGKTVSGLVRELIAQYLRQSPSSARFTRDLGAVLMTIRTRPRAAIGAATAMLALTFTTITPSFAKDIALMMDATFVERHLGNADSDPAVERRSLRTTVQLDFGEEASIRGGNVGGKSHIVTLKATETKKGDLLISLTLQSDENGEIRMISSPKMITPYGETAKIIIGDDSDPRSFAVEMTARKL